VAEFEQLALDSLVSPGGILLGQALNQGSHSVLDGWTAQTGWIRPFLGDQATMPAQDRARCDQAMSALHPDQRGEDRSVYPVQAGLRGGSAQHGDFVTQHQEFDVLGRRRAAEQ
jgi:hypothetical protein